MLLLIHWFPSSLPIGSVRRKLRAMKQEVCRVLADEGSVMNTCGSSAVMMRRNSHLMTRFHTQRSRFKSSNSRKKKRHRDKEQPSAPPTSRQKRTKKTRQEMVDRHDDIDYIFASIGEWHWTGQLDLFFWEPFQWILTCNSYILLLYAGTGCWSKVTTVGTQISTNRFPSIAVFKYTRNTWNNIISWMKLTRTMQCLFFTFRMLYKKVLEIWFFFFSE